MRWRIDITVGDGHDCGEFWHIDLYRNNGDFWQAVWSQATRLSD